MQRESDEAILQGMRIHLGITGRWPNSVELAPMILAGVQSTVANRLRALRQQGRVDGPRKGDPGWAVIDG
jgi:hypothetical protein